VVAAAIITIDYCTVLFFIMVESTVVKEAAVAV
jgi:hypothetical protein